MLTGFTHYKPAHVIPSPIGLELIPESFSHDVYTKSTRTALPSLLLQVNEVVVVAQLDAGHCWTQACVYFEALTLKHTI